LKGGDIESLNLLGIHRYNSTIHRNSRIYKAG
jgi:hypothetical protein